VPHGVDLEPDDRRLLRGRPPERALAWVAKSVGGARLLGVRSRSGGTSSAIHMLYLEDRQGERVRVVMRRYVRLDWLAEEPDLAAREAEMLEILENSDLPVPRLIAVDPSGEDAGNPAVLMTALPGRADWSPSDRGGWLEQLAAVLPVIHATQVPHDARIRPYRPYELGKELAPPPWIRYPRAWWRAIEVYQGPPPSADQVFLHRDYHPGNVLWRRRRLTGVVDWANASLGAPEADVGHCRANLFGQLGPAAAEDFLARWQAITGRTSYHPYWDIAVEVGPADSFDATPDPILDEWIARAVAEL